MRCYKKSCLSISNENGAHCGFSESAVKGDLMQKCIKRLILWIDPTNRAVSAAIDHVQAFAFAVAEHQSVLAR